MPLKSLIENSQCLSAAKKRVLLQFLEVSSDKQKSELKKVLESACKFEDRFEKIKEMQKQDAANKFSKSVNNLIDQKNEFR